MVLDKKETTIAYRCPSCGSGVVSIVGAFSLSADMIRMRCSCGNSEMTVQYRHDKRVRLTVPCLFCPTPHSYTISDEMFFRRKLTSLTCAYTGIEICFIGMKDDVLDALSRSERELFEMLGDDAADDIDSVRSASIKNRNELLPDPQVYDIVSFVVRDLQEEGKIHCRCSENCGSEYDSACQSDDGGHHSCGDYHVDIGEDSIRVMCSRCGASATFPANSVLTAHEFLLTDSLQLK